VNSRGRLICGDQSSPNTQALSRSSDIATFIRDASTLKVCKRVANTCRKPTVAAGVHGIPRRRLAPLWKYSNNASNSSRWKSRSSAPLLGGAQLRLPVLYCHNFWMRFSERGDTAGKRRGRTNHFPVEDMEIPPDVVPRRQGPCGHGRIHRARALLASEEAAAFMGFAVDLMRRFMPDADRSTLVMAAVWLVNQCNVFGNEKPIGERFCMDSGRRFLSAPPR
jgi:hypothetical protein